MKQTQGNELGPSDDGTLGRNVKQLLSPDSHPPQEPVRTTYINYIELLITDGKSDLKNTVNGVQSLHTDERKSTKERLLIYEKTS